MKQITAGALAALLAPFVPLARAEAQGVDRAGDAYEIRLERVSETRGEGSSSSRSTYTLVERVIAVRKGGLELEFDLAQNATEEDRARNWQFPARVFKPEAGAFELLNGSELETRVRAWLNAAGLTEEACGRWVFTWTAIKIECDPQSVLGTLEVFDLRPNEASASVRQIDPEVIRRERAETDVAVAEMTGQPPLTVEAALQARAAERYSGSITTSFEMDEADRVTRRIVVAEVEITESDGSKERTITTTTIERRLFVRSDP